MNSFIDRTGSSKINQPLVLFLLFISIIGIGYLVTTRGLMIIFLLLALPFAAYFLIRVFRNPVVAFFAAFTANFIALGLSRYIWGAPFGLAVDGFLSLTYLAIFFKYFYTKIDWKPVKNELTIVALIWYVYTVLEFFNPEVKNMSLWFYFMRSVSLYMLMTVVLTFLLFNKYKYLMYFLYFWCAFEILASIKAMIQIYIGLDLYEQYWLDTLGAPTHLLFGQLRAFSFFSDAGQLGASQAHTAMVAIIIAFTARKNREKIFFFITAFFCFYGMFLSGTRGIWGVLGGSMALFLILNRNFKVFIVGLIVGAAVFSFFRYTYIGQGVYFIYRMRTAFDPKNPSLLIRLENQNKLKPYLAVRPFGGGIGHAGTKALQYTPTAFLANIPTDSWYVQIWAEMGVVGLILHLTIVFFIILKGSNIIFHIREPDLRFKMIALLSGVFGIMFSSYGNGIYGQMPTCLLVYTSMAFVFMSKRFDDELALAKSDQNSLKEG